MTRALIIGGTGMLREASFAIRNHYDHMTVAARRPEELATALKAESLPIDWRNQPETELKLGKLVPSSLDLLVSWLHDDGLWCITPLESLLRPGGRSIRVHSSAVGDPAHGVKTDPPPRADIMRQDVVLGWIKEKNGRRWLTNSEISQGVINAFENPAQRSHIVGQVQ